MEKTRLLFPDKNGGLHKIVSIGMNEKNSAPDLYIFFTSNFSSVLSTGPQLYLNSDISKSHFRSTFVTF